MPRATYLQQVSRHRQPTLALALSCALAALSSTGCGPDPLPAFANPPPVDAGMDAARGDGAADASPDASDP